MVGRVKTLNKVYEFLKSNRNKEYGRSELRDLLHVEYYSLVYILDTLVSLGVIKEKDKRYWFDGC